ncbi:MAG: pantoate--beta-alanine ligase [Spirochaetae bacterium HGW-Spirochaetae-6]|nr:MAG: pantoate--beta-alanine ligase [Spirochaetae bacterium HGW-Spirochaetae-6]
MQIIEEPLLMQQTLSLLKAQGKSIGLVPTMGALHQGHMSLVKEARNKNDILVTSIFVNPAQFGANEDLASYPRPFEDDLRLLDLEGVDYVFAPGPHAIYPSGYATFINVDADFTRKLCGGKRPGHFQGVATIVGMLFNICLPDRAYFGLKDYQQVLVIKRMVKDLVIPVEVVAMPIFREPSGLAMSSRNKYLSDQEKQEAVALYQSLLGVKEKIARGEREAGKLKEYIAAKLAEIEGAKIDYVEIVDPETLTEVDILAAPVLVALAVFVGKARLIDNMLMVPGDEV